MTLNFIDIPTKPAHPNESVPRDGHGKPLVIPEAGGRPKALIRTTTFIDCIEDKSSLVDWGKRMVLVGAQKRPSLLDAVAELDPDDAADKKKLNALAERALDISGANDKREKGTHLHDLSEYVDRGDPLPAHASSQDLDDMMAYMAATAPLTVHAVEQFVVCSELGVGGTFDRTYGYEGLDPNGKPISGRFIGDLKTGSVEYGGLKMAMQLAIYSRAKKYDHTLFPAPVREDDEKGFQKWKKTEVEAAEAAKAYSVPEPVNQDWGIIVHLPSGKGVCNLYWVDLNIGWKAAQLALTIREMRSLSKKAMVPFAATVSQDTPHWVDFG
ncbi:exonuclease [Streptomyces phage Esperer]|uniref:Exonuclease n=2 Tax=Likavirus aaronocolus TaxID=1982884 RepID=A0A411CVI1_9CAUD|nr:exonuclease [Streptomyces phage Esperer]QAY17849.1 exonuclease [Streptomyces phage Nerdos]UJQ86449.1 exonuclease [Streptomyces phage SunsetPointe]